MEALDAVGQTYQQFRITHYVPIKELHSSLIELVHEPSGARIMHIANEDPENLFALSFRTLPTSSNGVAHILEHTVLCGSEKFPVKDPFFAMTRRSLNTYMNALTGEDFTCYPASTQVEKDFYNLLEVYLDAVFHPRLRKESFWQEGHRLAFKEADNPLSPLAIQGIVYNEMKGAMNSPDARLSRRLSSHLFPDLPYAYNSGGEPDEIPHLTLEQLREFHSEFYHPSRCLFFFYGNLPLTRHLDFLSREILDKTHPIPPLPPIPKQPRFTTPLYAKGRYPFPAHESPEQKAMIAIGWLTASISEQTDVLGLSLIASILMDTDASFLKKILLRSGLCARADASLDLEMSEIPFTILCKGCRENQAEELKKLCFDALEQFASHPVPSDAVETALHQLEFERTEIGAEGIPFGLSLFFRAALAKQHGISAESALAIHSLFEDLRARLQDPNFLPHLVRKYLLNNPHYVVLTMRADPGLEEEERRKEEKWLEKIQTTLTPKKKEEIIRQSKELATFQEEQENMPLDCLPTVSLKDIPESALQISLSENQAGPLSIFHADTFTNHILYTDLLFDLPELRNDQLSLCALYARLFTEVGCAGRTYEENLKALEAHTGGASASLSLHSTFANPQECKPSFTIRIKSLKRHTEALFGFLKDFSQGVDLTDTKRLLGWISQHAAELQHRFNKHAMQYAIQKACSSLSPSSFVYNEWHGLPYFEAVQRWTKDPHWIKELQTLQEILCKGPAALVLSCDQSHYQELQKARFYGLAEQLERSKNKAFHPWKGDFPPPTALPYAHVIASPVAFTAQALRTCSQNDPDSPLLLLAAELLDNVVLHPEIREKGGAYGSSARYSPSAGNFTLSSYRDPHFSRTLKTFEQAVKQIAEGDFEEEDLLDAKFGVIQSLDTPIPPGQRAYIAYSWHRCKISFAKRQLFRQKVLEATKAEVASAVQKHLLAKERTLATFLGKDLFEREQLENIFLKNSL